VKESIASTWVIQLVIGFILLFVSFLTLTLAYSKSYKIKNETLSIIEKYEGLTTDAVEIINNYMQYNNYNAMGKCDTNGWYGLNDFSVNILEPVQANEKYYYCIKKRIASNKKNFYELRTFFKFSLPIVGDFTYFTLEGTTSDVTSMDGTTYTEYN